MAKVLPLQAEALFIPVLLPLLLFALFDGFDLFVILAVVVKWVSALSNVAMRNVGEVVGDDIDGVNAAIQFADQEGPIRLATLLIADVVEIVRNVWLRRSLRKCFAKPCVDFFGKLGNRNDLTSTAVRRLIPH